jgi:hypothetical protein
MRTAAQVFGDPSTPTSVAAEAPARQPFSVPLGHYTGAPPQTLLKNELVSPASGATPSCIVSATRENRFVTLTAPLVGFLIYVGDSSGASLTQGIALPPGIPYEITLPGNQALYAVTDAPVYLRVRIQVAAAISGDLERRL